MGKVISFADVVHQTISFSRDIPSQRIILDLTDTAWFQRLRDISQTANTRLVYMFSEHSRFGHSLGAAYLAVTLLNHLKSDYSERVAPYELSISAAALLHDLGHLAPGSHTAFKVWFPQLPDTHEEVTIRIIREDPEIRQLLSLYDPKLLDAIAAILSHDASLPAWCWEMVSGSGWNIDRGNWCVVDSVMAGVSYGKYNIPALTDAICITHDGHLAVRENRLDALMHFSVSRHALYRQVYQHRVLLAADTLTKAIALRARDLGKDLVFADDTMRAVLTAQNVSELSLETIFEMREGWWRYHLSRWARDADKILADLAGRLLNRRLFKTVRIPLPDEDSRMHLRAEEVVRECGFDPRYYLHQLSRADVQAGEGKNQMRIVRSDGSIVTLAQADPLILTLYEKTGLEIHSWLAVPDEVRNRLERR